MAVDHSRLLTYEDYAAFPDDGTRREIIQGRVVVTPAPTTRHQRLVLRFGALFHDHLRQHGGGEAFIAPTDVLLSEHDIVQPDVLFIADERGEIVTEANIAGTPTLAIEIVSDPRTDRVRKRDLYARTGAAEYWIVDPDADRIEVHRLDGSTYGKPKIYERGETLTTPLLPGLHVDLEDLLRR